MGKDPPVLRADSENELHVGGAPGMGGGVAGGREEATLQLLMNMPRGPGTGTSPPEGELGHVGTVSAMVPLPPPRSSQPLFVIFFLFRAALQIPLSRLHLGELGKLGLPPTC